MKIVGKAKGKAPKAWCLMQNTKTGHYEVGYDGNWSLHGSYDAVLVKVQEAKDELAKQPVRPTVLPEVKHPGYRDWRIKIEDMPQEFQDATTAYEAYRATVYQADQWDKLEAKAHIVPLDYVPVFEDELRFIGYTRGRSSVTMQFEASNGQTIEFGPSGIDGLITGIIEQTCVPTVLTGTYEVQGPWDSVKREYGESTLQPRGKGIKARFKFAKKGQNTYAELTEL